jgi:hypothetical protein
MTEKPSNRSRRQPPTSTIKYKTQRSRSISNDLELGPVLLPIRRRERKTSMITDTDFTATVEKKSKVAELRERFEKMASAENTQSNIKDKNLSTQLARSPSAPATSTTSKI